MHQEFDPATDFARLRAHTTGHRAVRIAVLDGPVDADHPCFAGAFLQQAKVRVAADPEGVATRHGTHVASLIFGQPGSPVEGVASGCRGLTVPLFADKGDGVAVRSQLDLARAIDEALDWGAHIINVSGGEFEASGMAHPLLADAVAKCAARGVLIVAAAGNEGCACLHVPAALPAVLAVGAVDRAGRPLDFSNWGDVYQSQGLLAPGQDIEGAVPGGGTATMSGTSFATALVTGAAALLLSAQVRADQAPDPLAVRAILLASADPCDPADVGDCQRFLAGRLNADAAYARLLPDHFASKGEGMLQVGDPAPDFSALDHSGRTVRLGDYLGRPVVLWFYPRADTPY